MKILKFELQVIEEQTIMMPMGMRILKVDAQGLKLFIWVIGDTDKENYLPKTFYVFATGDELPQHIHACPYVGTVQIPAGAGVWHIFESAGIKQNG